MRLFLKKYIAMSVLCILVTSCWDANEAMKAIPSGDYLRTADIVVAGDTTQGTIHVEANCLWSISTNDSWLSLGTSFGQGSADVTVTMTANPYSDQERTAIVTLKSAGGITTTLTVKQERNSEKIIVTPAELIFVAEDNNYQEFTVIANGHWKITGTSSWVTLDVLEGTGNGSIRVTVSANTQENNRSHIMTITGDGGQTAMVTITQLGRNATLTASPQNFMVAATGEQKTILISGNVNWYLSTSDEWLTSFSALSGTEAKEVTFTCQPNHDIQQRTATITVLSENQRQKVTITVTQQAGQLPVLGKLLLLDSDDQQASMTCTVESMFEITEYGICYGETMNPTTAEQKVIAGKTTPEDGKFSTTVKGLTKGSSYHARAYAISAAGTAYSEDLSFVALPMPQNDDNDRPQFSRKK